MADDLRVYGKWPVLPTDKPLRPQKGTTTGPLQIGNVSPRGMTVEQAFAMALEVHYSALPSAKTYDVICRRIVSGLGPKVMFSDVGTAELDALVGKWRADGLSSATIKHYLYTTRRVFKLAAARAKASGVQKDRIPELPVVTLRRPPRWWLTPDLYEMVIGWCFEHDQLWLADYVDWTINTGLRVQETLRCRRHHFTGLTSERPLLTVPGTKTDNSETTLPISMEAARIAHARFEVGHVLFPIGEQRLRAIWNDCREALGLADIPTATPRALRRTFARVATDGGMPAAVLQRYMRHSDIKTTKGYLELVGGWDSEDVRKYLK